MPVQALLPRGPRHNFVFYGDSCSGIPGQPHEAKFCGVNAVLRRFLPPPEFIVFLGGEIAGLTVDANELQAQWRYWLESEMGWLHRRTIPLWSTTGNHTAYDRMSETLFRDVLGMPQHGPSGREGLSYWVRRDDLLLVFAHTLWTGLGGEGHVETSWLRATLRRHADARHKLVIGHHPVHPVNGFAGPYQRAIGPEHAAAFWNTLVCEGVTAYLCSPILAFDVQVHSGVLQICSAGAGTAHRMPEGIDPPRLAGFDVPLARQETRVASRNPGQGRSTPFADCHLRVGKIVTDTQATEPMPQQPFDTTEAATLSEQTLDGAAVALPPNADTFDSITHLGNGLCLRSWQNLPSAEAGISDTPGPRRVVRVTRGHGMFARAEAPRYFPG